MGYKWPNQISEKPVPSHFVGNTAHFRDGTKLEVDAIIMCTGDDLNITFNIAIIYFLTSYGAE